MCAYAHIHQRQPHTIHRHRKCVTGIEQTWSARSLPGLKITTYNSIPSTKVTSTQALTRTHTATIHKKNNKEKVDKQYHYKYISDIQETTGHVAEKSDPQIPQTLLLSTIITFYVII
jgi:hypothetical protein